MEIQTDGHSSSCKQLLKSKILKPWINCSKILSFPVFITLFLFVPASDEEHRTGYPEDKDAGGDGSPEKLCGQWAPWQPLNYRDLFNCANSNA